jgi:hypothetical protein
MCNIYIIYTLGDLPICKFTLINCRCIPKLNAISAMGCFDEPFKILILSILPQKETFTTKTIYVEELPLSPPMVSIGHETKFDKIGAYLGCILFTSLIE